MVTRRELKFSSWEEVIEDLNRLLRGGYDQAGKWTLSQNSRHLNDWLSFTMTGPPAAPLPMRMMMSVIRVLAGKRMLKQILEKGQMIAGGPTVPKTVYRTDNQTDGQSVDQLIETIERFRAYRQPIKPSPIFGDLDYETAQRLQWVHFAHHLSFLVPKET